MTQQDMVQHWQEGARKALHSAELLCAGGEYESALFHCHLAVEKMLKAVYIAEHDDACPKTHNLVLLAESISNKFSTEQMKLLRELTDHVVDARYDDPEWADTNATKKNALYWIDHVKMFLSLLS